jgi:superfamily II DNA or RNA helicase
MKSSQDLTPKDIIQEKAVKLSGEHNFLCLEWSTGTGKTLAAAKIVSNILKQNPSKKGYLICKESTHKKNWIDDLKKHKMDNVIDSLKNVLYASLKNQKEKADFIILDECHALTVLRLKALKNIMSRNTKVILLSATISKDKKYLIDSFFGKVHFYKIPLTKAIDLKLLPEPSLIVHKVRLNEEIVNGRYWEFKARSPKDKKIGMYKRCSHKDMFMTMKNNKKAWGVICVGTEKEHYDALTKQMAYFKGLHEDLSLPYPVREGCRTPSSF